MTSGAFDGDNDSVTSSASAADVIKNHNDSMVGTTTPTTGVGGGRVYAADESQSLRGN